MTKPVHQVIRINERGAARVLDGKSGMLFIVENWVGVEDRCAAVLDYRYPDPGAAGGYQCWTIEPEGFDIMLPSPTEASATTTVAVEINWDHVANAMVSVVEGGYSPWFGRLDEDQTDENSVALRAELIAAGTMLDERATGCDEWRGEIERVAEELRDKIDARETLREEWRNWNEQEESNSANDLEDDDYSEPSEEEPPADDEDIIAEAIEEIQGAAPSF